MNWKKLLKIRLKIIAFILALVGWFMSITVSLEKVFKQDLSALETLMQSTTVKWAIRICVLALLIVLIRGQERINQILVRSSRLKMTIRIICYGGVIGWIIGLGSLIAF